MPAEREIYPLNKKEQDPVDLTKSSLTYFEAAEKHKHAVKTHSRIKKLIAFAYSAPLVILMSVYQKNNRNHYSEASFPSLPPPLTEEEELCLLEKLDTPEKKQAQSSLVERNLRLVAYIAKKYSNSGIEMDDLVSIGTIGLIKAIRSFDKDRNIKLATYASKCIENEIRMTLRYYKKYQAVASLEDSLNIDEEGNALTLYDVAQIDELSIPEQVESKLFMESLRQLIDSGILGRTDTLLISGRFGLSDGIERTQKELVEILGISQSYISRKEKTIIEKIKKLLSL